MSEKKETRLECPEGYDYGALRVFLRVGNRSGIPEQFRAHLIGCEACAEKWQFLKGTDPIVKRQFREQVEGLITEVEAREILLPAKAGAVDDEVRAEWRTKVAGALAVKTSDLSFSPQLWTSEPLGIRDTIEICAGIRCVPDDALRRRKADATAWVFTQRVQVHREAPDFLERLLRWPESVVDLSDGTRLGVAPEIATEVIASIADVSYCQHPVLLEYDGTKPVFRNRELLRRAQSHLTLES